MSLPADFEVIFNQLKTILVPYAESLVLVKDAHDEYLINTQHVMKNGNAMYFGSAKINKNYVSFHLMPVYVFPELLEKITPELKRRMQGKSCFNFKVLDHQLINELSDLTQKGYQCYKRSGYL